MATDGARKKKTLGRGMEDLIGDTLENLVRGAGGPKGRDVAPTGAADAAEATPGETAGARRSQEPIAAGAPGSAAATARVVAVASGKGGTGKSLIAVNLAVALAEIRRVALIDVDFGLANAHILLGLLPRYDVSHLLRGERSIDDVVLPGPRGVMVLPGASGVPELAALADRDLEHIVAAIAPLTRRSDLVILDCPAGLTRQSLLFLHGADVILIVTTEDLTSMTNAYALIKTVVTHRPQAAVGLVVNGARTPADGAETYRKISHVARKFLGREVLSLGTVPRDAAMERSVRERRPIVLAHPTAPSARAILDLALRLQAFESAEPFLDFPERVNRILAAAGGRMPESPAAEPLSCAS